MRLPVLPEVIPKCINVISQCSINSSIVRQYLIRLEKISLKGEIPWSFHYSKWSTVPQQGCSTGGSLWLFDKHAPPEAFRTSKTCSRVPFRLSESSEEVISLKDSCALRDSWPPLPDNVVEIQNVMQFFIRANKSKHNLETFDVCLLLSINVPFPNIASGRWNWIQQQTLSFSKNG